MSKLIVEKLIEHFGSQRALGVALCITQPAISHWRRTGKIPFRWLVRIEDITNGAFTRHHFYPDLYQ